MVICTASCSDLTGLLETKSLLSCDIASNERVTGEGLLVIVEISEKEAYVATVVAVDALVVAGVVVVVAVTPMESRLIAMVVVVKDYIKSRLSQSTAPMLLVDVKVMSVGHHQLWFRW